MSDQGDFTPVVKGGYESDDPLHRRNWRYLSDFLRTNFVTKSRLADGSVDRFKVQDGEITNAKIENLEVSKLTAGQLTAEVVLGSSITAQGTEDDSGTVTMDSQGLRVNDGTDDVVNLRVSGESSFEGGITASSLSSKASTLSGETVIDGGGTVDFVGGLGNPSVAPSLSWVYTEYDLDALPANVRAAAYDSTDTRVLVCSPPAQKVYGFPAAGGTWAWSHDYVSPGGAGYIPYGVTRVGSFIYILYLSPSGQITLTKWNTSSGAPTTLATSQTLSGPPTGVLDYLSGMTYDGVYIVYCYVTNSGNVHISRHNATTLAFVDTKQLEAGYGTANRKVYDIQYESTHASARWYVIWSNSSNGNVGVRAYDDAATPATVASQHFAITSESRGVAHDGSKFLTVSHDGGYYREHTDWFPSAGYVHAKYSWYDNTNTYETKASADAYVDYVRRAKLKVTWPTIPSLADRARVYLDETGSTTAPAVGAMNLQGAFTGKSTMLSTYNSGGAADKSSNTFPNTTSAALILPRGNGSYLGSGPVEGEVYYDTTDNALYAYDGADWNSVQSFMGGQAVKSSQESGFNGGYVVVQFTTPVEDALDFDPYGIWDPTNDRWNISAFGRVGVYEVTAHVTWDTPVANHTQRKVCIYETNGATILVEDFLVVSNTTYPQSQDLKVKWYWSGSGTPRLQLQADSDDTGGLPGHRILADNTWFGWQWLGPKANV